MPMGIDTGPPEADTLLTVEREPGRAGPAPADERTEIRWARCEGEDVVVKAGSEQLRERLRREAEVLRRCGSLPVVDLIELVEAADHTELVTARFGALTLAESGLLDPFERGAALAGFCEAVQALHDGGWAHGALTASHVLVEPASPDPASVEPRGSDPVTVEPGGGVRLCSLADGVEFGAVPADGAEATDRDAVATVVTEVLTEPAGFDSGRARRRWGRAAKRATAKLAAARGLRSAAEVLEVLRSAGLPGTDADAPPRARGRRGPSRRSVAVAAVCLCVLSGAVAWAVSPGVAESADEPPCADVEADGSCDPVDVDGQVITVGTRIYDVGRPGDIPRLGDWGCDGEATVALLRPATGEVFTFDGWAAQDQPVDGALVGTFEGATDLVDPSGCGPIEVVLEDGSVVSTVAGGGAG